MSDASNSDKMVAVARFPTPGEAHIVAGQLNAGGIEAWVEPYRTVDMLGRGMDPDGISVYVAQSDLAAAEQAIEEMKAGGEDDAVAD